MQRAREMNGLTILIFSFIYLTPVFITTAKEVLFLSTLNY